jgi:hypothetical protein
VKSFSQAPKTMPLSSTSRIRTGSGTMPRTGARVPKILAFAAASAISLSGCSREDKPTIVVDRPGVFTRERLVARRVRETQFLEQKLDTFVETINGYNDVREFSGMMASIQGAFNPFQGALSLAQGNNTINNLNRQDQLSQLQQQLSVSLLNKQIAAVNGFTNTAGLGTKVLSQPLQTGSNATYLAAGTNVPQVPFGGTNMFFVGQPPTVNSSFTSRTLVDPASLVASQARLSAIDTLTDEMAYRDFIQAALREKELDDTHDLLGYTLYTLKFDVTLLPNEVVKAVHGRVQIRLLPIGLGELFPEDPSVPATSKVKDYDPTNSARLRRFYRAWRSNVQRRMWQETIILRRSLLNHQLTDADRLAFFASLDRTLSSLQRAPDSTPWGIKVVANASANMGFRPDWLAQTQDPQLKLLHDYVGGVPKAYAQAQQTQVAVRRAADIDLAKLVEFVVEDRFVQLTSNSSGTVQAGLGLFEFKGGGATLPDDLGGGAMPVIDTDARMENEHLRNFYEAIKALFARHDPAATGATLEKQVEAPYVYSVEPKQSAQNISDVASAEKLTDFILSLRATLPQAGVDAQGYLEKMNDSQRRIQAILRQPLVVGYADRKQVFGWTFGPQFRAGAHAKMEFVQVPVQHSLQATVAVPAWMPWLKLKVDRYWGQQAAGSQTEMVVNLPGDLNALTSAFLSLNDGTAAHQPLIQPHWDDDPANRQLVLQSGGAETQSQTLLIRGSELWRNPAVFVGNQKARNIEILPDMMGLLATFDRIPTPPAIAGKAGEFPKADLTIVTSGGAQTLTDAVTLVPASGVNAAAAPGSVTLAQAFQVADGELSFRVDPSVIPKSFANLALKLQPAGSIAGPVASPATFEIPPTSWDRLTFRVAGSAHFTDQSFWATTSLVLADVRLKLLPTSTDDKSILPNGSVSFVHFALADEEKLNVIGGPVTVTYDKFGTPAVAENGKPSKAAIVHIGLATKAKRDLFYQAYPGLQDAVANHRAALVLRTKSGAPPVMTLSVKEDDDRLVTGFQADVPSNQLGTLPSGTNVAALLQLEYPVASGNASIPFVSSASNAVTIIAP